MVGIFRSIIQKRAGIYAGLFGFLFFFVFSTHAFAQFVTPVKWNYTVKQSGADAELIFTASIDKGWHLYSQNIPPGGPVPTSFIFEKPSGYTLLGKASEPKGESHYDSSFAMTLKFFSKKAVFNQKIKITSPKDFVLKGELEFMVCDDEKCLPPELVPFSFNIKGVAIKGDTTGAIPEIKNGDTNAGLAIAPVKVEPPSGPDTKASPDLLKANEPKPSSSMLAIFFAGFVGGLLALLTPCVFPMIPLTVSFFTKQSKSKSKGITNALLYGASIILIYVGLGFIITKSLGADALNDMASNVYVNLGFFFIFMIFAISFLGAFEITVPASWINSADRISDKGGLIGIFFMAFTLSLVSFSCTGPIIGTLLVETALGGNVAGPITGMTGFAVALALPFGLFAAFPGWLNSLPKSGGWLNSVKVVLGMLELALALKFLSVVDLAYHWEILTREVFLALWIVIFSTLGFYLLGKIKFSHDSDTNQVTIPRYFLAVLSFSFVVYLIPGMWGAPLKLISGFPPPMFYTEGWAITSGSNANSHDNKASITGVDRAHCPHNLSCFHDYDLALAYSKKVNKPLFVDFTGWSCVNCRKMEDKVWIDPRVLERLENDYVLVSLYVDDKKALPPEDVYVSESTGKTIKTIGNKWSDFQFRAFKTQSQPYYVLLDGNEKLLTEPTAFDTDIDKYIEFMDAGKKEFEKRKASASSH